MEPKRVLHILDGLGSGGTESFIMNIYKNIDRNKIQFDFLIRNTTGNIFLDEIKKLGGKVYTTSSFPKHFLKNYKEVNTFFKNHNYYEIVHIHANALMYITPLILTKKYGVKCRILHSHNTQPANKHIYKYVHKLNKKIYLKKATDFFACSNLAGKWMFNNGYRVVNNAIDIEKFTFEEQSRSRIRKDFKVEDKFLIGNVGRFTYQKNHTLLIDIFNEVYQRNNNAVLMLVGEGELLESIKEKVKVLGLQKNVIFTGVRKDVSDILCALDVFLLPSHYEGLGIVLVEAQTSGLPSITSANVVPKEVEITDLLEYLPLNASVNEWANEVLKHKKLASRKNMTNQIKNVGYDIKDVVLELEDFYLNH